MFILQSKTPQSKLICVYNGLDVCNKKTKWVHTLKQLKTKETWFTYLKEYDTIENLITEENIFAELL